MAAVDSFGAEGFTQRFPAAAVPGTVDILGRAFGTYHEIPFSDA